MNNNEQVLISEGCKTAFIDSNISSELQYRPQLVFNDYEEGRKVLSTIEKELLTCDEFFISVAFISSSGLTPLLQTLKELERKNVHGRILTTNYLTFSEPKALDIIANLSNIELKMYSCDTVNWGFHTKGYIFRKNDVYHIIVGSSNLTANAMTKNKEWNTKLVATTDGEYTHNILEEFEVLWNSEHSKEYSNFIDDYREQYRIQKEIAANHILKSIAQDSLKPNKMQREFVKNVQNMKENGASRALLISATGTGKTYASAFSLRESSPRKVLFLVHREQIAKQAIDSYKKVLGSQKTFGLLSGNSHDYNADYLFSTMQMMSKPEVLARFNREEFDTIIIDEVHRAGADSYQRIMNYYNPKFWLGMTASPERTDDFDIFSLFDHNIAYEIRLQDALEQEMLCPFHYFGISDLTINGEVFDDNTGLRNFSKLVSDTRVDYVIEQAKYYGYYGNRVKGLIFCSRKEEARELSEKFNERGFNTVALSGEDSQERRESCIERLVSDNTNNYLDYIFTVDIFNEGVDIPEVNQIIMLRPTQSPIIFVQQLGRGLRKAKNKEYVVILDFIGNYLNNYMIPIALSGDRTYNKDTIRRYVIEGTRIIPGNSTIHFDEVSRKRIFESIDVANFNNIKLIKDSYKQLKNKLGRIPSLMDFELYGSIDPVRIFESNSLGSYHKFLSKYEDEYDIKFSEIQEKMLEFICKKFASGKRVHELISIQYLMEHKSGLFEYLKRTLKEDYSLKFEPKTQINMVNVLTNHFTSGTGANTYSDCILIQKDNNDYSISDSFSNMLENPEFYRQVEEIVQYGLYKNEKDYDKRYKDTSFQLYAKYTYDDVCRLLEWEKGEVALNIGGYKYDEATKTYPIFINYEKSEDIQDTIRYEDCLLTPSLLKAISKAGRSISSNDVQVALNAEKLGVEMDLFIRKNKDDKTSKEFYYLGKIYATGEYQSFVMPNTTKTAVEIYYSLDTPVREDIYDYIVN